jgi:hypothetical protein
MSFIQKLRDMRNYAKDTINQKTRNYISNCIGEKIRTRIFENFLLEKLLYKSECIIDISIIYRIQELNEDKIYNEYINKKIEEYEKDCLIEMLCEYYSNINLDILEIHCNDNEKTYKIKITV